MNLIQSRQATSHYLFSLSLMIWMNIRRLGWVSDEAVAGLAVEALLLEGEGRFIGNPFQTSV